jgi:hypothetical protein
MLSRAWQCSELELELTHTTHIHMWPVVRVVVAYSVIWSNTGHIATGM